jgi:nicotinate-nucleotide adenylyltransferase
MPRIGVMPGAFNPLTCAHLALVDAAREVVDEVICVVPRAYPHKEFHGATWEQRVEMLVRANGPYRVEACAGGLFVDIARELRRDLAGADLHFICGRDAAERILHWDYGDQGPVERVLEEFSLLVAARQGEFAAPEHLRGRVAPLMIPPGLDDHSSSEVRRRIAAGEPWEDMVPETIVDLIRKVY